jgi:hypothetical protein
MENKFIVYGLCDPQTNTLEYIGKSCSGLKRPNQHFSNTELNRKCKKSSWVKSILAKGLVPTIEILEVCENAETLSDAEIFWIANILASGASLRNMSKGGNGGNTGGWTKESSIKLKESLKKSEKFKEANRKNGEKRKGIPRPAHVREALLSARQSAICTEETKQLLRESRLKQDLTKLYSKEARQKISDSSSRPENLENLRNIHKKLRGVPRTDEVRQAISKTKGGRPIVDQNGVVYQNQADAVRKLNLNSSHHISCVLKGKRKTVKGFTFTYCSDI